MAQQTINVGTTANDGTGDSLRNGFIKVNQNFTELYTNRISGSGTDNYIPRFNGTNALENSIIFDNGTNVGIGTTSPSQKVQIGDGTGTGSQYLRISSSASEIYIGQSGGTILGLAGNSAQLILGDHLNFPLAIGTTNVQPLIFGTTNNERMRITSGGNVGIGTTSPTLAKLVLNSGTTNQNALINGDKIGFTRTSDSAEVVYFKKDTSLGAEGTANINGYDGIQFRTQGAESVKAIITSIGRFGIGTSSPASALHVSSSGEISRLQSSTTTLYNTYVANGVSVGYIGNGTGVVGGGSATDFGIQSPNNFVLATGGGTERMRITSTGIVQVSSGDIFGGNLASDYGALTLRGGYGATTGSASKIEIRGYEGGGGTQGALIFYTNGTERMKVMQNGNVGIGTSLPFSKFEIVGLATSWSNSPSIIFSDNAGTINSRRWLIGNVATDYGSLNFAVSSTNSNDPTNSKMTITKEGNVGIGTTIPTSKLHVVGLPTSSAGLTSGAIWNDGGTLKIV